MYFIAIIPLISIIAITYFLEIEAKVTITLIVFCAILFVLSIIALKLREKNNSSSFKRRIILLATMGVFIVFLIILSLINGNLWQIVSSNVGTWLQFILLITLFLYAFFRKDKMSE